MIKPNKEKILENRIARLEKLIKATKHITNESLPRTGMTLGQILALYTGNNPNNFSRIMQDLKMTDTLYFIADEAGVSKSVASTYIRDLWNNPCKIKVNKSANSNYDEVIIMVDDFSFSLDWMYEDEAYEACSHTSMRQHR